MGSSQLYSLTWGEFGTSLVSAVQLLRCHGDLVDVTLAAGGRSFPAHKIVLCAASPFLLNLLKSTPCQHPVVMLAGVTAPDLEALLEFVYRGEVSVDPNQLPSLLQAAHCLNIQGLAPGTISSEKPEELASVPSAHEALTRDVINSFLPIRRRKRTKRRNSTGSGGKWARQDNTDDENRPIEQHSQQPQQSVGTGDGVTGVTGVPMTSESDILNIPDATRKTEETDSQTQTGEETANAKKNSVSDQPAVCPLCGATLRQSRNLRRHLELLHFGVGRSTVRVRTRKISTTQQQQPQQGQQTGQTGQDVATTTTPQSPPSVTSTLSQPDLHSPPIVSQPNMQSPTLGLVMPVQQMTHVSTGPHIMALPPVCQNGQSLRIPRHEDIHQHHQQQQQQQQQQTQTQSERPGGSGLCEPSPVLGCMLPPMPSPHDPLFRHHQTDLLRGVGLYAETRGPPPRPNGNPSGLRQEVV